MVQATRPLRHSSAQGEVGSPERDKWEKRTPVAKTAVCLPVSPLQRRGLPSFTPRALDRKETDLEIGSKIWRLKIFFFFLLYCPTEPLRFTSQALCCYHKDQKPLFLLFTTPEVPRVSRTCGFGTTPNHCWDGLVSDG